MPRFTIAYNQEYFDDIFNFVESTDNEVSQAAWSLVRTATTNPRLYRKVIALDLDPDFDWHQIFDASSIQKMLYVLQIVEALLEESSMIHEFKQKNNDAELTEEDGMKLDWI